MNQQPNITMSKASTYLEVYANNCQLRASVSDFLIQFGRVEQTGPESLEVTHLAGIYLSPQQAKALRNVLTQNVANYEENFGEIRLDPVKLASLESHLKQ